MVHPKKRTWYDFHCSEILFFNPSSIKDDATFLYGYSCESKMSYYRVYSDVFNRIYANELDYAKPMVGVDVMREPSTLRD